MSPPPADETSPDVLIYRVAALERAHTDLIAQIKATGDRSEARMEALALKLDAAMTHMRAHACPTPGACTSLMRDTADLIKTAERFQKVIEKHETDISALRMTAAEGRVGLRVTIFWVGIMSSSIGGFVALVLPIVVNLIRGQQ